MIRTKIIATMGPAVADVSTLVALFQAGCDVCRLNFSHGSLEAHGQQLARVREAAEKFGQPIAILGDLCGPKIRLAKVKPVDDTGGMPIRPGDTLHLHAQSIEGADGHVGSNYPGLFEDVEVGQRVFVEDGLMRFLCVEKHDGVLELKCTAGGILKSNKGINLPDSKVRLPALTAADWKAADWSVDNGLDFLALSFVRKASELEQLRAHVSSRGSEVHLIAKIEQNEAVRDIDAIIEACDGLMIARGDLGVEMDAALVPLIQKDLIRRCQAAAKPVIVATQMLQSMVEQSSPTRAEVSDVANAIFDGTDVIMLSGETSVGKFPVGAVHTMSHISRITEEYITATPEYLNLRRPRTDKLSLGSALAYGVRQIALDTDAKLVAVFSLTGTTARVFSKHRFPVPLIGLTSDPKALRRLMLCYGVMPIEMHPPKDLANFVEAVDKLLQERNLAQPGDRVIIVAGASMGTPATMNGIVPHVIGSPAVPVIEIAS